MTDKTPQQRDAQFAQPLPAYPYKDDEISLVDLASTLVKRWRLMALVFIAIVLAGFAYALTLPQQYDYVTIYSSARLNADTPLESAESLQSKINAIYLPEQIRALQNEKQLENLPFSVQVSSPKDTQLITLTSKAQPEDKELVATLHHAIALQLKAEQDEQSEQRIILLQQRLEAAKQQLEFVLANNSNKSGEIAASLMIDASEIESKISDFIPGKIVTETSQSLKPKGTSKSLIMALALVLGCMLAVISVFIREFSSQVCTSLKTDNK
ncbi:Wzz/FepE/Etk N-terminal domain-containing protein [Oceanisphaera avium]|uniref:Polysaccharide chain length determinant N-terminal domain-containing protein n=1 Tax=Oceanisphaera avium TaxID=1903694 RepID=A0A1Y0CV92_9GAMM|nr:Wzz/FepE/Etk N-terminal domain-containing protein [Oceanisphaera avium]ART78817.1 hypothetical protein CBP12_00485 [Oceanisphaera avium]